MSKGKPVNVLVSSIRVLRFISDAEQPLRASHVARTLNINPSTCFNILQTLLTEDLVSFDESSGTYGPGLGLISLASSAIRKIGFRGWVRPHLEDLAHRFRVTTTLWQRLGSDRVILTDFAEGGSPVRIAMNIGQRLPVLVGALGRCMAAYADMSEDDIRQHYKSLRSSSLLPFDRFMEQVAETRRHGYAVDTGQFVDGVTTISSPIREADGRPLGAISMVGLSAQFPDDASREAAGKALVAVTEKINPVLSGIRPATQAP